MAASRSTSPKTTFGDLPPSSSETFFRLPAAACRISLPTSVEPVKATLSTSGCAAKRGARRFAISRDDIHDAIGNAGFLNQLAEKQSRTAAFVPLV